MKKIFTHNIDTIFINRYIHITASRKQLKTTKRQNRKAAKKRQPEVGNRKWGTGNQSEWIKVPRVI